MFRRHLSKIELIDSLDGALTGARARWARMHLDRCQACASQRSQMQSACEAVRSLRAVPAPAGLRARVLGVADLPAGERPTCRQIAPVLHRHVEGQLAPAPMAALALHLRACARCRTELAALRAARRLVQSLPPLAPPERVREAVYAARAAAPMREFWGGRLRPALAAAGIAAALGVLLLLRGPTPEIARQPGPTTIAERPPSSPEAPVPPISSERPPAPGATAPAAEEVTAAGPAEPADEPPAPARPRMVARVPKGPSPAPTSEETRTAGITAPSALLTLKAVAGGAARDREVQLAMDLAGERFATLRSEAMLHLPQEVGSPASTEVVPSTSGPSVSPDFLRAPEEISEGAPKPDSGGMATANFTASRAV